MQKRYFKFKLRSEEFVNTTTKMIDSLSNKKVIVFDNSKVFKSFDKVFNLSKKVKIIGFISSTKNFEELNKIAVKKGCDVIIVLSDHNPEVVMYGIKDFLENKEIPIYLVFSEKLRDTQINIEYLLKYNIEKSVDNLSKKLKNKKVLFYGGGLLFKLMHQYFDISSIGAIGVVDKKLSCLEELDNICGYKLYKPNDILKLNPDYIVITTKRHLETANDLYEDYLKHTNIKIIPLLNKSLMMTLKGN